MAESARHRERTCDDAEDREKLLLSKQPRQLLAS